jgi:hypothetical protein
MVLHKIPEGCAIFSTVILQIHSRRKKSERAMAVKHLRITGVRLFLLELFVFLPIKRYNPHPFQGTNRQQHRFGAARVEVPTS